MKAARHRANHRHAAHSVVPEPLYRHIADSIAATPSARVRTSTRRIAALAVAAVLTILVVALASELVYGRQAAGLRVGLDSTTKVIATGVLTLGLAGAATVAALWRGRHGFGAPALALAMIAVLVAPLYALFTWMDPVHTVTSGIGAVRISPWGTRCLVIAALVGTIVWSTFTLALRRAVPVAPRSRAAAIGACAGAWAGLAVFVFCPSGDPQHLFLGHVLPIVGLTVLGALLLPRWLRP